MRRGPLGALTALLVVLALVVPVAPAAAGGPAGAATPRPGHPWFGPALDIRSDSPAAYAERLGATPSLYTFPIDLPLTGDGVDQLHRFAAQVAEQGAVLVLQVEPTVPLDDLTGTDDASVAHLVSGLVDDLGLEVLVRFAPEMNGSWRPWGQQPDRYVAAFRGVADAVHAATPSAAMVWSPVYGSGYPFTAETGADSEIDLSGTRQTAALDTDGNGRLDAGDDPYGPYYPGDDAVDWVGLFLYRFGQSQGIRRNVVPPPAEMAGRLAERWGYPRAGRDSFYERFSVGHDRPLLLETAALHNPAVGGATQLEVERAWWRQTFAALADHPMIAGISWLELSREEPEVADEPVDWGVTGTPALASAFRSDLETSPVTLGPVTDPVVAKRTPTDPSPTQRQLGPLVAGDGAGATAARAAALALALVLLLALAGSRRRSWAYVDIAERDLRVDVARGALLLAAVALHLPAAGPLHDVASGAAALGGLESFVLLSGVCVGLTYPALAERLGHAAAAGRRLRRAFVIWVAAVTTVVATYVLSLLPGLDLEDIGTVGRPGAQLDLYAGARHLFDYPPPGWIAQDLLALRLGSWLLLPLALFVVLQLLSPLAAGPLARGWWWAALPVSWGVYALGRWSGAEPLPSYSEAIAPILVWQVLFVHGIALGRYRDRVAGLLRRPAGVALLVVLVAATSTTLWTGAAPSGSAADLPLLRFLVVTVAILVALAVLTTCWRPLATGLRGWVLPLGQAALLVVVAQPLLVLVIAWAVRRLPDGTSPLVGTVLTVAAVTLLVMTARWSSQSRRRTPPTAAG